MLAKVTTVLKEESWKCSQEVADRHNPDSAIEGIVTPFKAELIKIRYMQSIAE
jgi:hypothetical protein